MSKSTTKATPKTQATTASVDAYLAERGSDAQQADARVLMALMGRLTGAPPKMWGPSIVGFGAYRYTYDSGRSGESCLVGFALRGRETVLYLAVDDPAQQALLARLGPHKMGKACLYLKRLADVDGEVLEQLVAGSIADIQRRYPGGQP